LLNPGKINCQTKNIYISFLTHSKNTMKLTNYLIDSKDKLTSSNKNNAFQYIRARVDKSNTHESQIILDTLLEDSIPLVGNISGEPIEDGRKYFGEFTNVSGIFLYKQNIVVTKGTLFFRNKEYLGLEFLANQSIELKIAVNNFIDKIYKNRFPERNKYQLTPLKRIDNQF
jgi:hypothetical protein